MNRASRHSRPAAIDRLRTGVLRGEAGRPIALAVILAGLAILVSAFNPGFATAQNLRDLLVQSAPVVIVGCGMTFLVITGEIDISVGSLLGLLAAIMGILSSPQHLGLPAGAVIGLTLLTGAAAGLVNGLLVVIGRVPSIIATLAMLTILRGITEFAMAGRWITDLPPAIRILGTGTAAGLPWCIWVAGVVLAGSLFMGRRAALGLRLYAVGGTRKRPPLRGFPPLASGSSPSRWSAH